MFRKWTLKTTLIKAIKFTGYFTLGIVALLLLLILAVQLPFVQNKLVDRATGFLQNKIGTKVSLDHISLSFPKKIVLDGIYLQGQDVDTLLYAGKLSIDTDLWSLTQSEIQLNDVSLDNTIVHINRSSEGVFNFDYIIDAFAGEPTTPQDTSSSSWTFTVGDLELVNISAVYRDSTTGNNIRANVSELLVDVDNLDLENSSLEISEIQMKDSRADVIQWTVDNKVSSPPDTSGSKPFGFSVGSVILSDISADYRQVTDDTHARVNIGNFEFEAETMDLARQVLEIDHIELSQSFISFQQRSHQNELARKDTLKTEVGDSSRWNIVVKDVRLTDNNAQYYDNAFPSTPNVVDFNHLWLTRFNFIASDLSLEGNSFKGIVQDLSFVDKSGLRVSAMKGQFGLADQQASVKDFLIRTPSTKIALNAGAEYPSLDRVELARINLELLPSTIAVEDILYFQRDFLDSLPLKISEREVVKVSAKIDGTVKDLVIRQFHTEALSSTVVDLNGTVSGLPESNLRFDVRLEKFHTDRADMKSILPDTLLPSNFTIPAWIDLTATLRGTTDRPQLNGHLTSDMGAIALRAKLSQPNGADPNYSGDVSIQNFQVGKLIGQADQLGNLTMKATVAGKGFSMDKLRAKVELIVDSVEYNNYKYQDFRLNGEVDRYLFTGNAFMKDKNLEFDIKGNTDYNAEVPLYKLTFNLVNADFKALGLAQRPLRARGTLDIKMATSDFKILNGNLDLRKVAIYNGEDLYSVDSLLFASIDQRGESTISIRSDIISGDFKGTINLASIPQAITAHFGEYFSTQTTSAEKPSAPQKFNFSLVLKNTDLLTEILIPDLDPFIPGRIEGEFDSEANTLNLHADVARIGYAGVGLDSLVMDITSDKKSLDYTLALRKVAFDSLKIEAVKLTGKVANDSIRSRFIILDSAQRQKYVFGGAFYSEEKNMRFRLLPDEVTLNYAPWTTPVDNYLTFTPDGILAHDFSITNINERISFITREEKEQRTAIVFKDLNLQNITNMVEGAILVDGLLNGDFIVSGKGEFNSSLKIADLEVLEQEWGELALTLAHETSGALDIDLGITGINAELQAKGKFIPDSVASTIEVVTNISRINLKVIEPFTGGQLKNSSGILTGEVKVSGKAASPDIRGFVAFNDATIIPTFVNSKFLLRDEKISFTEEGIVLNNFTVRDEKNNTATLKGKIKTTDYSSFDLDLNLNAKNFQLLNTKAGENDLFYGSVGVNTTARITGTMTQPKVEMEISLNDDSDVTYIIPQSEKGVLEQKGIIEWVDEDASKDPFLAKINVRDTVKSTFTGLELTANIELDDKEKLSIIIDPVTGDKLTVQGNATLTLDINPSGDMALSGRYEITQGGYDLTFYKLVKRNFAIEKGSTITWSGSPLDASLDIKASFQVETSPMELVASQTTGSTTDNSYKQRLPFLVYLNIDGNLMTPEISFELDMPPDKRGALGGAVYAKIKDINTRESDLNKQVFALLILRRFISDNLFDSQGGDVASTARRSVSKLLTEQLNRLSENVKGVELSFDVKSYDDYSTGQAEGQTEVQLGVSKSLLDDRLIVKVSGNVDIEGNASNQSSLSDYIGDLALEYKLTPDGRFRITGFRNSNYDIISGELIETGAGLIYIKDYNTLRELFKANAKEK